MCLFVTATTVVMQVKRVIQGEAAGDLVLEEDLKLGGAGIPIGQEGAGAGLDGLKEGRRPKGPYVRGSLASVCCSGGCFVLLRQEMLGSFSC